MTCARARRWTNWSGDERCAPARIERPTNEGELRGAVLRAARAGEKVRPVGSGHSFTDAACTDGVMVDLSQMHRVLAADVERGLVTVEAGIDLRSLGAELARRGRALENQGDIDRQALGGAVATATHGTGAGFQNLSARVAALRLVTAGGDVLELSRKTDPEGYLAARVSVGSLGVVSALTLECVPLFTLHRRDEPRPLDETLDRLDEHVDSNDHFEFFLFPYASRTLNRYSERTAREPVPVSHLQRWLREAVIENGALALSCRAGRAVNGAVPLLNRTLTALASAAERTDRSHRVYASRRAVRFTEMEYAVPRERARDAVERVVELIERRRLPVTFPIEVRFAAPDDAYLSTAYGRDTCYIAVHQYRGMEYESFFRGVEEIMDSFEGRPHWGKRHYRSAADLRERYPAWDRFQAVRSRLDPGGVFTNDYARRTLGPVAARPAG